MPLQIGESDEVITTHAGLSLVGRLLDKTQLKQRLNAVQLPGQVSPPPHRRRPLRGAVAAAARAASPHHQIVIAPTRKLDSPALRSAHEGG